MDGDFKFEQQFCHYFKFLRENSSSGMKEVMLNCNIDRCLSIHNDKISISFCYDSSRFDVENEKHRLDKQAVKCELYECGW